MAENGGRIVPIVLAGGQGTRLWPMSRASRPKQFLPLLGPRSPFQETLLRVRDSALYAPPVVITNADYRFIVAEQAEEAGVALTAVLLEPVMRNTLPAIAASAIFSSALFGADCVLHILPSDHALDADDGYRAAVATAARAAAAGRLVTFGITPTSPATGYGYIAAGAEADGVRSVKRFVEKPDRSRAQEMLAAGNHYWNSGMFMLPARPFIAECQTLAADVLAAVSDAVGAARNDLDFVRLDEAAFARSPALSIDYGIFEKTALAAVIPVTFAWSDLGSWDAVHAAGRADAEGNVAMGPSTLSATRASLVISDGAHVAVDGLDDIAVIAADDAVYVGRLGAAQRVGQMVSRLRDNPATRALTESDRTAHRPWGGYASILEGERFQVKRLFVKPGKRLSLQKHHHRSEHWVVVRGTAEITIGDTVRAVSENESVYIPAGVQHRLANPGKILLELIEIQTGSYLGEDDIIRIADEFGRN